LPVTNLFKKQGKLLLQKSWCQRRSISSYFCRHLPFPDAKTRYYFYSDRDTGFIFGFIYLAVSVYLDRKGTSNINHSAHFYGALAGIMLLIVFGYAFSKYDLVQNFVMQMKQF
jgi:hypothetical protein